MNRAALLFIAAASALSIAAPASADALTEAHHRALKHFTHNESGVKDAIWTSPTMIKLGMLDNGTPRDGFALYACEVLSQYGFKGKAIRVQIIDIAKLVRTNKWTKLGEASCL